MKEQIDPDLEKLEVFFHAGLSSLQQDADRIAYGKAEKLAGEASLNPQTLTDARQFARRVGSQAKFKSLIAHAQRHKTKFGMTFCIRLLAADDADWHELIKEAGKHEWSSKQLAREIRLRYPNSSQRRRHSAGRLPGAYANAHSYVTGLAECCQRCQKMLDDGRSGKVAGLPETLKIRAQGLSKSLAEFHKRLNDIARDA